MVLDSQFSLLYNNELVNKVLYEYELNDGDQLQTGGQ